MVNLLHTLKSLFVKPPVVINEPAKPAEPERKKVNLRSMSEVMAYLAGTDDTDNAAFVKYKLPDLPPGVRPARGASFELMAADGLPERDCMAYDDATGGQNAMFSFLNTTTLGAGLSFPGFPFLASLQQISEYRAPCEVLSSEMTREWIEVVTKGESATADGGQDKTDTDPDNTQDPDNANLDDDIGKPQKGKVPGEGEASPEDNEKDDKIRQITERMEELKLRERFQQAALYDLQFGGGHLYWEFKGAESDAGRQLPLVISEIKKGTLLRVTAIEPYWMTPFSYNADKPNLPDFYVPQSWMMLGKKTATSRLMIFIGRPVPDLLKPSYNFTGISLAQLMAPYIDRWLRTAKSVNDLINIFSIVNLATNMNAMLADGGDNGLTLAQRMKAFTAGRDNRGVMITNFDTEELKIVEASLASLDKLQAQSQEHMAAPCHIPLIKLFGITPSGLNATTEGEFQAFYDWLLSQCNHVFGDHLKRALEIVQMDLFGVVDDEITFKFKPLWTPTAKELAEIRKADAERDNTYVTMGAISPDEVRARLAGDPNSGYDGLQGDAPGPPIDPNTPVDPETGLPTEPSEPGSETPPDDPDADRQHASTEADKDRKHASSEADKDRAHALKLQKAKPKPKPAAKK